MFILYVFSSFRSLYLETALFPGTVFIARWFSSVRYNAQRPGHTPGLWTDISRGTWRVLARAPVHQWHARVLRLGAVLERSLVRDADGGILND